jgi:CheY-like chemotaxis protein
VASPLGGPDDGEQMRHATRALRVMIVDDNKDAADTLEAFLTMEGFSVAVAYDGAAALEKVQLHAPDVVLMDIGMPRMDGYEAARMLRAAGRPLRLIALTGWGQALDKAKAQEAGFDRHFVKPVDLATIVEALRA